MVDLSKGLFVENLGLLIPWGITNEEAWQIGNPRPWNLPEDKSRVKWDNAVIFDGLECVIQTYFPNAQAGLNQFNILDAHYEQHTPKIWGEELRTRCESIFGQKHEDNVWVQGDVVVALAYTDRFIEAFWLKVAREVEYLT